MTLKWLERSSSFLDHENLGCTQRECKPNERILSEYRRNVRITNFCWSNWKITRVGKASRKDGGVVLRHGRARSNMRWEILRTSKPKDRATFHSLMFLLGWSSFQERGTWISWRIVKSMLTKFLVMLVPGHEWSRPDILWSVNKLARSFTKWTRACDRRLARLISYKHHTSDYRQHCHMGNMALHCRLGLFPDSDFAGDLEDSKSTSAGILCITESRTFVSKKLGV